MPTNLENSAAATGLEKVSFHPNPNETVSYSVVYESCDLMYYSPPGSSSDKNSV